MLENDEKSKGKPTQFEILVTDKYSQRLQDEANCLSRICFFWTNSIMAKGWSKTYQTSDLFDVRLDQEPKINAELADEAVAQVQEEEPDSISDKSLLYKVLKKRTINRFILSNLFALLANLLTFSGPFVINGILTYISGGNSVSRELAFGYAGILVGCYFLRMLLQQNAFHMINDMSVTTFNTLNSVLFSKMMRLSQCSLKYIEPGKLVTMFSVDLRTIDMFLQVNTALVTAPVVIIVCTGLMIDQVGPVGIAVPFLLFGGILSQNWLMKEGFAVRKEILTYMDRRNKLVSECLTGIRVLKYYGWEDMFLSRIAEIRRTENELNVKSLRIRAIIQVIMSILPVFTVIFVFGIYAAVNGVDVTGKDTNKLTVAKVYTVLSLFNIIQMPLRLLVVSISAIIDARASLTRMSKYFGYSDLDRKGFLPHTGFSVEISKVQFSYDHLPTRLYHEERQGELNHQQSSINAIREEEPGVMPTEQKQKVALDIDQLRFEEGKLSCVVGKVGSGKSTLLNGLIGQVTLLRGQVKICEKVALVSQTAWLMSTTLRDNILFGSKYQEQLYNKVVRLCELTDDINLFPGGDQTQIGERGINVSGGQKQRISLARALYMQADVYLIDDCLSALDHEVGRKIFENVIKGHLKGKTIVFVTHGLHFVKQADFAVVLDQGKVVEKGHPSSLRGEFLKQLQHQDVQEETKQSKEKAKEKEKQKEKQKEKKKDVTLMKVGDKESGALVQVEERMTGGVEWSVYFKYFLKAGVFYNIWLLLLLCLGQGSRMASDWWVGAWSSNQLLFSNDKYTYYIWIYALISIGVGIIILLRGFAFAEFITRASQGLQSQLMQVLMQTPLAWYDVTPMGRVLARTSKDQDNIDNQIAFTLQFTLVNVFLMLGTIILNGVSNPYYFIIAFISILIFYGAIKIYLASAREIKRLDDNARAPLLSYISESLNGLSFIRASGAAQRFLTKFTVVMKKALVPMVNNNNTSRWISIVSDLFAIVLIGATAFLGVGMATMSATNVGLSLIWSLSLSGVVSSTLKFSGDTENAMNSVVRILGYIENNPQERSYVEPPRPEGWPKKGLVQGKKVSYRYRPELPRVVDGINFSFDPQMKVGIVGRTGSGKSTITLGLLRILELTDNVDGSEGSIAVDKHVIGQLGLHHLRHNVTIIPQDAVLFSGTVRSNIDPFDQFSNEQVVQVLKKAQIYSQVQKGAGDDQTAQVLSGEIASGGTNYSLGQRQLFCMARALIVIFQQATTSSADNGRGHCQHRLAHGLADPVDDPDLVQVGHSNNDRAQAQHDHPVRPHFGPWRGQSSVIRTTCRAAR